MCVCVCVDGCVCVCGGGYINKNNGTEMLIGLTASTTALASLLEQQCGLSSPETHVFLLQLRKTEIEINMQSVQRCYEPITFSLNSKHLA